MKDVKSGNPNFGVLPFLSNLSLRESKKDVPVEESECIGLGLTMHLAPAFFFIAVLSIFGRAWEILLSSFFILSIISLWAIIFLEERMPSVELPKRTLATWFEGLSLVFLKGVVSGSLVVIFGWAVLSMLVKQATNNISFDNGSWLTILVAVMLTDLTYYWIHRSLNHGKGKTFVHKWYQKKHVTHHSVEVLDFLRGNVSSFMDTAVTGFQIPLAIISVLLGMDLTSTMIAYGLVLMLQATHHANHTFNIGWLRFIFMDNHAHKLHHCPRGYLVNHGALFSIWDQLFGTYYEDWDLSANHLQKNRIPIPIKR